MWMSHLICPGQTTKCHPHTKTTPMVCVMKYPELLLQNTYGNITKNWEQDFNSS